MLPWTNSFIEVTSGIVLLWRMAVDDDVQTRERNEKLSLRIVVGCFLAADLDVKEMGATINARMGLNTWAAFVGTK